MDFTNSYYHSRSIYLGLPNSVDISPEGLKGKRIGVQEHTQQEIFLQRHWADVVELIRFHPLTGEGSPEKRTARSWPSSVWLQQGHRSRRMEKGCTVEDA